MERHFSRLVYRPLEDLFGELGGKARFDQLLQRLGSTGLLHRFSEAKAIGSDDVWSVLLNALFALEKIGRITRVDGDTWVLTRPQVPPVPPTAEPLTEPLLEARPDRLVLIVDDLLDRDPDWHVNDLESLSPSDLREIVRQVNERMRKSRDARRRVYTRIERCSSLSRLIKAMRGYSCQVCGPQSPGVFASQTGLPYVETHHIDPLSQGGPDIEENVLVVCATCHRKFHYGSDTARPERSADGRHLTVVLCGVQTVIQDYTRAVK